MIENPNVICNDCGFCKQNTQLKKLLKKHRDIFARTLALCIDLNFSEKQKNQFSDDIAEIDQALGEDK